MFTDKLHDVTEVLRQNNISPEYGDHIVGMYEAETEVPHFLYYEARIERVNLFKFIIDLELGEGRGDDHIERRAMIEKRKAARITNDIVIIHEDRMRMRPTRIIEDKGLFEPENDAGRRVWDDQENCER